MYRSVFTPGSRRVAADSSPGVRPSVVACIATCTAHVACAIMVSCGSGSPYSGPSEPNEPVGRTRWQDRRRNHWADETVLHFKGGNEMKIKKHIVVTIIVIGHLAVSIKTTHAGGITPVPKLVAVTEDRVVISENNGGAVREVYSDSRRQSSAGAGFRDLAINSLDARPQDFVGAKIYIADADTGRILRLMIGDHDPQNAADVTIMVQGLTSPSGVAFDRDSRLVYWSDETDGIIYRTTVPEAGFLIVGCVATNGGCGEEVFLAATNPIRPRENVRVCSASDERCGNAGSIYWTERKEPAESDTGTVMFANLGPPNPTTNVLVSGLHTPVGLSIGGDHIYWTDTGTSTIRRADLATTGQDPSVKPLVLNVFGSVGIGIAFDRAGLAPIEAAKMFWTRTAGEIRERDIDGDGGGNPFGGPPGPVTGIRVLPPPGLLGIPTTSTWGVVIMLLLVLAAGTVALRQIRASTS